MPDGWSFSDLMGGLGSLFGQGGQQGISEVNLPESEFAAPNQASGHSAGTYDFTEPYYKQLGMDAPPAPLPSQQAVAQSNQPAQVQEPPKPGMLEMIFPFIAIMVVFYFFQSRPQQKRQKQHQDFLTALKRGDEIITTGGIVGQVTGLTEKFITLEIAENVRIRVLKTQILGSAKEGNS